MYTIQQDSVNKIVIPFNGTDYGFLLIVFSYSCYESVGIFENVAGTGCDYEIVVNEVGSNGTSDPENGDVKISPRSTWKGEVYGQDNNVNLFPQYAAFIEDYKFQVKGDSCNVYPNLSPQIDCLPATAIVQDQDGNELAREDIASGAQQIITVNVQTMINVAKGDFTGVFDLSVTDQNGFYNDYTEGSVINTLSLAASPKLGSIATVRILGGLLGDNAIPEDWDNFSIDAISQDNSQFNVLTILYVAADDVRIVNNVIAAPDFAAPEFTSAPTATNIEETSFDITAQLNENGTVYGYLLSDGSPAPTVQEIIDNAQSQFTDSGSGGTLSFTGLTNETNYDVYVVAEDTAGNKQASPVLVEVLTAGAISPEAQAVIDRMTAPSATEETAISNFVDTLVSSGDFELIDEFHFFQMESQVNSLVGWKGVANATNVNASWSQALGFTTNGTNSYINTGFNPSVNGSNYALTNAMVGGGVITNRTPAGTGGTLVGCRDGVTNSSHLFQGTTSVIEYRLHINVSNAYTGQTSFQASNYYTTLNGTTRRLNINGSIVDTKTAANGTNIPNANHYVGAFNDNGGSQLFYMNADLGFYIVGAGTINVTNVNNAINQLKNDLGL